MHKRIGLLALGLVAAWATAAVIVPAQAAEKLAASSETATGGLSKETSSSSMSDEQVIAMIDEQIRQGWTESGYTPSAKATDNEWCRRVYLDVLGRIPTVDEVSRYVTDRTPDKKAKLVDRLLGDEYIEEYGRNWASVWSIRLVGRPPAGRNPRELVNREGMQKFLRDGFLHNKPYDQMVYELVSATGSTTPGEDNFNGAVNFLVGKLQENATEATARTAKYFLGLQVQCTQCHNHPFNDWKQEQFWSMNAFFRQTRAIPGTREGRQVLSSLLINQDFKGEGETPKEAEIYYELRNGTMAVAYPTFVDGTRINPSGYLDEVDRRAELGSLIIKSEYLGKSLSNFMWAHFFGYGFTKPIDDMGPHNAPSHPMLVERLGKEFSAQGHDLKRMIRWLTLTEAYSLSSKIQKGKNDKDDPTLGEKPKFSHFYLRQMEPEQLYESLLVATVADKASGGYEEQERLKADWLRQFTITFGNDEGDEATTFDGTIPQALMMMNGTLMAKATSIQQGSYLYNLAASARSPAEAIDHMYLSSLSRKPAGTDLAAARALLEIRGGDRASAFQDIWWALLNTNEFIFVH